MAEQQLNDFRMAFVQMCYNPNFETLKVDYLKTLPDKLKLFSDFLGKNKWFAGNNITYVDFLLYEMLAQHKLFAPDCLKNFSNLDEFVKRFEDLPTIKKYMKSDKFLKWPLNGDMAKFGSRNTPCPQ